MDENGDRIYTDEEMQEYIDVNNEEELELTDNDDIETKITNFKTLSDALVDSINEYDNALTSSDLNLISQIDVEKITTDLEKLHQLYRNIAEDMKIARSTDKEVQFSMSSGKIAGVVNKNKGRLKRLKIQQINKYNARIDAVNKKIEELKNKTDLTDEVVTMVEGLNPLDRCELEVTDWKYTQHVKSIDYSKLVETEKNLAVVDEKLNVKRPSPVIEGLDADMELINKNVSKLETEIKEDMPEEEVKTKEQELENVTESVNRFETELSKNEDVIAEDLYVIYLDEAIDLKKKLAKLKEILDKKKKYSNDYDRLDAKLEDISKNVTNISEELDANRGVLSENWINERMKALTALEQELSDTKEDVEGRNTEGKLDKQQHENLTNKASDIELLINDTKDRLLDPGMVKGADIYGVLNNDIRVINEKIEELRTQVNGLEKPIKDKETRKLVDAIIKELEKRIKRLEKTLSQYKNDDPEKYNATVEELNKTKEKLNEVSGEYRKKCPLMVKTVKSAKQFFKKYKKQILIIAGLASFALVSHHVLIPAIMHGNMMIWQTVPALRNFMSFTNRILGGMIGATEVIKNAWTLSNGVLINPSVASTSLLKGLAISGVGSTALVAPVIVAIKKLITKMNLKQKFVEGYEKGKTKAEENSSKRKEKTQKKKAENKTKKYFIKLLNEYYKSGKTLDEFCSELELTDKEKEALSILDEMFQENMENNKSKGKGK